jgi:hypothetical protein
MFFWLSAVTALATGFLKWRRTCISLRGLVFRACAISLLPLSVFYEGVRLRATVVPCVGLTVDANARVSDRANGQPR